MVLPSWRNSKSIPQRHMSICFPRTLAGREFPMAFCSINNPILLFYKEARPGGRILYHLRKNTAQKGEGDTHNRNAVFLPSLSPVKGSSPRKDFWGPFNPLQTFLCTFACTQGLPLPCSHSNFQPPYYIFY